MVLDKHFVFFDETSTEDTSNVMYNTSGALLVLEVYGDTSPTLVVECINDVNNIDQWFTNAMIFNKATRGTFGESE